MRSDAESRLVAQMRQPTLSSSPHPHPVLRVTFSRLEKAVRPVTTRLQATVQLHCRSARRAGEKIVRPVNPIRCAGPFH